MRVWEDKAREIVYEVLKEDELVDFLNTTITLFKDLPTYQVCAERLSVPIVN